MASPGRFAAPPLPRSFCCLVAVASGANSIIASLAGKCGLSTAGFVIERKAFELVLLRRRNRDIRIGPAVGCSQRFVEDDPELTIDPKIAPGLLQRFPAVARIEYHWTLDFFSPTPVAAKLQPEGTAFEWVYPLE